MPQSLDHVLIHLVFSTKDRRPFLADAETRAGLWGYMAGIVREMGCGCPRVGGAKDHVHLAIRLSRSVTIADLVERIKTSTSKWLKSAKPALHEFAWQRGYAVFSVGPKNTAALLRYIDEQEAHHRTRTFEEEYRSLLTQYGIAFDERYVWD